MNKEAQRRKSFPKEILATLDLKPNQNIADIGSGGGYFSYEFSKAVLPNGKVFALDTDHNLLHIVCKSAKRQGLNNLTIVPVTPSATPQLPEKVRLIFLRNVYHHLENPHGYFLYLKNFLGPEGKIAIIDFHGKSFWQKIFPHYTKPEKIISAMSQAGFKLSSSYDFLPKQSFLVFSPK